MAKAGAEAVTEVVYTSAAEIDAEVDADVEAEAKTGAQAKAGTKSGAKSIAGAKAGATAAVAAGANMIGENMERNEKEVKGGILKDGIPYALSNRFKKIKKMYLIENIYGDKIVTNGGLIVEISKVEETSLTVKNVDAENPSFDVTPAKLITGIITECGVIKSPTRTKVMKVIG